jgi:hypothetical protein
MHYASSHKRNPETEEIVLPTIAGASQIDFHAVIGWS